MARKSAAMSMEGGMAWVNPKQVGMTLGFFLALVHFGWAIAVAIGLAQWLVNLSFYAHMLHFTTTSAATYLIAGPFDLAATITLLVLTFVGGFVGGWLFGTVWNWVGAMKMQM